MEKQKSTKIIIMDSLTDQIQKMIDAAVEKRYSDAMKVNVPKPIRKTNLDLNDAIEYLYSIGYKCSVSQIYKLSMKNEIPFTKFGRRMMFDADSLSKWVEAKKQKTIDVSMAVSKSATSKLQRA